MAAATLSTAGSVSNDFDVVTGTRYVIAATGNFAGGKVQLAYSLSATPTVFADFVEGGFREGFTREISASPGTKIRATLLYPNQYGQTSSVNIELNDAV